MLIFKIRDRVTGEVMVSLEDRLTKLLGSALTTPNVAGSVEVPGDSTIGDIWYTQEIIGALPRINRVDFSVSGNTLYWPAIEQQMIIRYGRW